MRWRQITEGVEIDCSTCGDLIGKAKELPKGKVTCGNCGNTENNPYGYEHSKSNDEKFGRLVLTNLEVEDGTTQGTLKTSKGVALGSLIQYGSKWHDYDGGKWEAYCVAIKKRRTGFPDKKKAVDWIVRQTRASMKQEVTEDTGDFDNIPDWDTQDIQDTAPVAEFQKRGRFADQPQVVWVYKKKGLFFATLGDEDLKFKSLDKLQAWLTANGFITHIGTTTVNL